ncbi:hypothetical protein SCc_577 [Serratia symbiotica str. 'Cinara cedri']|nr:hypothetical protein SCc_577 [Serratia symbiotica str. 'Cinara cedri']
MKLKVLSTVLCSSLLLQGCIAGVMIGGAAIATKTATDPRSIGTQVDDATLEARVENALNNDLQLKRETRVVVTAYQGKVLLTGQSPNVYMTRRATEIAMEVKGASEVYNEIRYGNPINWSAVSSDTWITTKVNSQLLNSIGVKLTHVKVNTENGEVFLLGLVTRQEGYIIAKIASQISGVKRVTTAFSYIK